ncbi:hypothetical protein FB639_005900, partial [Coemansia asiatica]
MEAVTGESGGDGNEADNTAAATETRSLSPLPGPADQGFLNNIDDSLSGTNAEFTITLLWGASRYPPNMRKPQETDIDILGLPDDDLPSPPYSASASSSLTDQTQALPVNEKEEHKDSKTNKVVPSAVIASVVAVAIVVGAILWLRRKKNRKSASFMHPPPALSGHHSNSSFSSLQSTSTSTSTSTSNSNPIYPSAPGPLRIHSSSSLDALMSPFASSPRHPHTPPRPRPRRQGRQQEMTQVPPRSGFGSNAENHLMHTPTSMPPSPPLPRRTRSDHDQQHRDQHSPPPPLPRRHMSHQAP